MKILQIVQKHVHSQNLLRARIITRCYSSVVPTTETKSGVKAEVDKQKKPPFVKNLFLGKFDTDILFFPETLEVNRLKELENKFAVVDRIFEKGDSTDNTQQKLNECKLLGLYGSQVPEGYGGLDLSATEYARFCEAMSQDVPAAIAMTAHQAYGLHGLLVAGNEKQKEKYLPRLALGEWIGTFGFAEPHNSTDAVGINTEAKLSVEDNTWCINGSKVIVSGTVNPDIITVIAKTDNADGRSKDLLTLSTFIVERTCEGVSFDKTTDIMGGRGIYISEVHFKNTIIPMDNLVGEIGDGYKHCAKIMSNNRFSAGCLAAGILRKILEQIAHHCVHKQQLGKPLMDFQLIQKKVTDIAFSIYILESMVYMTTGILDRYDSPDADVEGAIVKVCSAEMLRNGIQECQNILGSFEFFKDNSYDTLLRDTKIYMLLEGSNDVLRMFIALSGFQHAGKVLHEEVYKTRNPTMYPKYFFKKMFERRNHLKDQPKLNLGLSDFVHPSLEKSVNILEYCVLRFQYVVEVLLLRHGRNIVDKEIELSMLTDIAIALYAMTAVIARSSRSYCTGIQNADDEIHMTNAICNNYMNLVKERVNSILNGPFINFEGTYVGVAEKVFQEKGYFLQHPLVRNIT